MHNINAFEKKGNHNQQYTIAFREKQYAAE